MAKYDVEYFVPTYPTFFIQTLSNMRWKDGESLGKFCPLWKCLSVNLPERGLCNVCRFL